MGRRLPAAASRSREAAAQPVPRSTANYPNDLALDKRVVIAGGGRVGFQVASLLEESGHTPFVVEPDAERIAESSERHTSMMVQGDATRPAILERAAVEWATPSPR
ncbi:MAG: NAD-binding protein [Haloplanus sp.]